MIDGGRFPWLHIPVATKRKRSGPGRPPLPKGEAQTELVRLRVQPKTKRRWERAAKRAGMALSEWIRQTLDRAAEP